MPFRKRDMTIDWANEILEWKYEAPYDFYNNEATDESVKELLETPYHAVVDEKEQLVGFFCSGCAAQVPIGSQFGAYTENLVDIGIGMNPDLTGKGNGAAFFSFVLDFIQDEFPGTHIRLTVANFNLRAIHLYEKLGFRKKMEFPRGPVDFITMVKG